MHTFSICALKTLQNITKTVAQNYREGQTGVKYYALIQGYTLSHVPFLHVCQAHYYAVVSVREALHPFLFMPMSWSMCSITYYFRNSSVSINNVTNVNYDIDLQKMYVYSCKMPQMLCLTR